MAGWLVYTKVTTIDHDLPDFSDYADYLDQICKRNFLASKDSGIFFILKKLYSNSLWSFAPH
jgi:hypothetical protein